MAQVILKANWQGRDLVRYRWHPQGFPVYIPDHQVPFLPSDAKVVTMDDEDYETPQVKDLKRDVNGKPVGAIDPETNSLRDFDDVRKGVEAQDVRTKLLSVSAEAEAAKAAELLRKRQDHATKMREAKAAKAAKKEQTV